ncbi:MAG: serine protease [Candidatus Doudnabacteria bacterium]
MINNKFNNSIVSATMVVCTVLTFIPSHAVFAAVGQNNVKSVVAIKIYDTLTNKYISTGSGVAIDSRNILTNYHVVENAVLSPVRYRVVFCTSMVINNLPDCSYVANPYGLLGHEQGKFSQELDLAIITLVGKFTPAGFKSITDMAINEFPDMGFIQLGNNSIDPVNYRFQIGDSVETLGYPANGTSANSNIPLTYSQGQINGFAYSDKNPGLLKWIKSSAKINLGSSGGGAFDASGKFLGIMSGRWIDSKGQFMQSYLIPATTINSWLQGQGYQVNKNEGFTASAPAAVITAK